MTNRFFTPGIKKSIQEADAKRLGVWLACDVAGLGISAKNYVNSHEIPADLGRDMGQMLTWIDSLVQDAIVNPDNKDQNLRTLYLDIYKIGKRRGIGWIIKSCRK